MRFVVLLGLAFAGAMAGCSRTADEDQCQKLQDKMVDLMAEGSTEHVEKVKNGVKRDKRAALLSRETCVGKITRSQYECMMAAKSLETFTACDK
jgi:hypothetical protein